ncbi:Protein-methionine-sulfoxide reductase catalytic subunit MsrP [hydrothermal vent metagenome]|uniref:Protein-methionine-sulfoxide reductase catalytic subunit MsrP n=1 Tax=hydrothermal vent metagenome TaxID=652676 RepID=A0A3B0U8U5_9ZZZZ
MLIKSPPGWKIRESEATPEEFYINRRTLIKVMAGAAAAVSSVNLSRPALGQEGRGQEGRAMLDFIPNGDYAPDRETTPEQVNITYNNFYEFGSHKQISNAANQDLKPRPWLIEIDGMVNKPLTLDVDELIAKVGLEERVYRHRCVEAWSMTVPWVGFALKGLIDLVEPLGSAKYLRMQTFGDANMARGIRTQPWYPWPYIEGITMAEATNDLAFLVVGAYGKQVANSMGAPIRLHLPWKYGFKSIKSIVRFSFVEERPVGFWETISSGREYGFWANVNPQVNHPRWSQASERVLHTGDRVPTLLYNGYGEQVADLYAGIKGQNLFR